MAALDDLIAELERSYTETRDRMSDPAVYNDHREAAEVGRRLKQLEGPYALSQQWKQARDDLQAARGDSELSEMVGDKLLHIATTTREQSPAMGRMTDWIRDGRLADATGGPLDPATDRVMICGSMAMLRDHKALCEEAGFVEGSNSEPGQFVIEKAFVD